MVTLPLHAQPTAATAEPRPTLLDFDLTELGALPELAEHEPYRARQLFHAVHARFVDSWEEARLLPPR